MRDFEHPLMAAGSRALAIFCVIACAAAPSLAKSPAKSATAQGREIACRFTPPKGGWLPKQMILTLRGDDVFVRDNVTEYFEIKDQTAQVDIDNTKRITYVWTVKGVKDRLNQHVNFSYRVTIQKETLKARISGRPLGYDNTFEAAGACTGY